MNLTVIGCGYVGLVTGSCLSDIGHNVLCLDSDKSKIRKLNKGIMPIYENGLEELVTSNLKAKRLQFSNSYKEAVKHSNVIFIAVDTPPKRNGDADLSSINKVCESICPYIDRDLILIEKSTVPVGTSEYIGALISKLMNKKQKRHNVDIVSNPEFLKEGTAIDDFMRPDRIIIGLNNMQQKDLFNEIYHPFSRKYNKLMFMDVRSSELTKYAANSMLATKISFINEISHIADTLDIDIENIRKGIGADKRIGSEFLYPGCGYGGSCFPKDIMALISTFKKNGLPAKILQAVDEVNENQKKYLTKKIMKFFKNNIKNKTFCVWGLAFKPKTDDTRFSPSIDIIDHLITKGAKIHAYDPLASHKDIFKINYKEYKNAQNAIKNTDALIICTEWKEFWSIDPKYFLENMKHPTIFDGRNIYDPQKMIKNGINYFAIGRGAKP